MNKIIITQNWDWFLAEVEWMQNIFAYWETKEDAKKELLWVLEMMMDYHLELVEKSRKLKNKILSHAI
jgi:hypothetical protein